MQTEQDVSDATMDVLTHQLRTADPLDNGEKSVSIMIDTDQHVDINELADKITTKIQ